MNATIPGQVALGDKGSSGNEQPQSPMDRRLDEELAQTFPASDPPSAVSPGAGETPQPRDEDQSDRDHDAGASG